MILPCEQSLRGSLSMIKIGQFRDRGDGRAAFTGGWPGLRYPLTEVFSRNLGSKAEKLDGRNFLVKVDVTKIYMGHSMGKT